MTINKNQADNILRHMSEASWDVAAWLDKPGGHYEPASVDVADRKRLVEEILALSQIHKPINYAY